MEEPFPKSPGLTSAQPQVRFYSKTPLLSTPSREPFMLTPLLGTLVTRQGLVKQLWKDGTLAFSATRALNQQRSWRNTAKMEAMLVL